DPGRSEPGPRATPGRPGLCVEARLSHGQGVFDLTLVASTVGDRLALAVLRDECEFALVVDEPLVVLCYRFGEAIPWSSVVVERAEPSPCERDPSTPVEPSDVRALLSVRLLDGDRNARATRNVTLSLGFSRALREAIRDQGRMGSDPRAFDQALDRLRRKCP